MRFSAADVHRDGLHQLVLTDDASGTQASVLPGHGALLNQFSIATNKGPFNCIDGYSSGDELDRLLDKSFKSSKLSPFVCRIAAGKYQFNGHHYEFDKKFGDGSAIHGLLYNRSFGVIELGSDEQAAFATCSCLYSREDPGYPFTYRCTVSYRLSAGNALEITTTVTNLDNSAIPVCDGWHPYFTLGARADDWVLGIRSQTMLEFDERLLPTGKELPDGRFATPVVLGDTQLDNCFRLGESSTNAAACTLFNPANGLRLSIFAGRAYPYLQVFTPPTRTSIALENLSAAPNAFNNGMGLLLLQPGDSHSFATTYTFTN